MAGIVEAVDAIGRRRHPNQQKALDRVNAAKKVPTGLVCLRPLVLVTARERRDLMALSPKERGDAIASVLPRTSAEAKRVPRNMGRERLMPSLHVTSAIAKRIMTLSPEVRGMLVRWALRAAKR